MTDTTPETLRRIVALCRPIETDHTLALWINANSGGELLLKHADHVLAKARRVLRERGVDVRWAIDRDEWRGHWLDGKCGRCTVPHPTEADAILSALESVQPKKYWSCSGPIIIEHADWKMRALSSSEVVALLNAALRKGGA